MSISTTNCKVLISSQCSSETYPPAENLKHFLRLMITATDQQGFSTQTAEYTLHRMCEKDFIGGYGLFFWSPCYEFMF